MPIANAEANCRVNALIDEVRRPLDLPVHCGADLPALRERWANLEAAPVIRETREDGVDQSWLGLDVRTFLAGEQSAGQMSMHSIVLAPGSALPTHYHDQVETFVIVVEGEPQLQIGNQIETGAQFSFAYAPARTRIGFWNNSQAPVWLNLICRPAGLERAFAECQNHWTATQDQNEGTYTEILARYGFRFDDAALENDSRVNTAITPIEFELKVEGDLERLREKLNARPAVPRLVHTSQEDVASDGPDVGFRKRLLGGEESAGSAMVNFVSRIPPAPNHYQPTEEELFFILEGKLAMTCGNASVVLGKGGFAFAPRNCTHGFGPPGPSVDHKFMTLNSPAGHEHAMAALRRLQKVGITDQEFREYSSYGGFIIH